MANPSAKHKQINADHTKPAYGAFAVTPADSDLAKPARAVYVGGAGDVAVIMASGDEVTFSGCLAGTILPIQVIQIKAATTATNILALT